MFRSDHPVEFGVFGGGSCHGDIILITINPANTLVARIVPDGR